MADKSRASAYNMATAFKVIPMRYPTEMEVFCMAQTDDYKTMPRDEYRDSRG